jgi:hypothetical protein
MAAIVDEYLETPMDTDDVFPCKGCGEVGAPLPSNQTFFALIRAAGVTVTLLTKAIIV